MIRRVMLVDDNKLDNFFHEMVLRKCNADLTIIAHTSPKLALAYLLNKEELSQPELVFLDINMPEMTGWEFLESYRSLQSENTIRFVMMSSEVPDPENILDFKDFVIDFATKPLTVPYVYDVLFNKIQLNTG